jgi:DNA-directed RNA polymerase specialized sigma24 family protein
LAQAASFDRTRASTATWIYTIARNKRIDLLEGLSADQLIDGEAVAAAGWLRRQHRQLRRRRVRWDLM